MQMRALAIDPGAVVFDRDEDVAAGLLRRKPDRADLGLAQGVPTALAAAFGPYISRGRLADAACCRAASRHTG